MAKNSVSDWSATDSLNTDVGGTNIAEGCAPGGINDAIRKVMAQVAGFVANAVFGGVTINGNAPTLTVNGGGGSGDATILLSSGGTFRYGLSGRAGGAVHASDVHTFRNLSESVTYLTAGAGVAAFGAAATFAGGGSASGMLRATGQSATNIGQAAGAELLYDGTLAVVQGYDRAGLAYRPLRLNGSDVAIGPQAGPAFAIALNGNTSNAGILALGGAALGGVNGQIQFNRADGSANLGTIGWQSGNEFRLSNNAGGAITALINGSEALRVSGGGAGVIAPAQIRCGPSGANGSIRLVPGDPAHSGSVEFIDPAGSAIGSIQQVIGNAIVHTNINGGGHSFQGGNVAVTAGSLSTRASGAGGIAMKPGSASVTGTLTMTDAIGNPSASIGGQAIGQPTAYANTSGHAFNAFVSATGLVEGVTPGYGTTGGLRTRGDPAGGSAIVQFTNNDVSDEWASIVADPGGAKLTIIIGHHPMLSIDGNGNVRAAGAFLANTAP